MFTQYKVASLRGDINVPNVEIEEFLSENNVPAIPFNIVYGPNALNGIRVPVMFSYDDLIDAIKKAS